MTSLRLAVTAGSFLAGALTGVTGYTAIYGNPQDNIHVEYEELAKHRSRVTPGGDILKYGAPVRSPDVSHYTNHALCYDQARKIPLWVAENITKHKLKGEANRKHSKFRPDPDVAAMFTAENNDYWRSGWSRGHMAPAGDNKYNQNAMDESFLLSNVLPQDLDNNGGFWNRFEMYCRELTKRFDDVRVISGPLLLPTSSEQDGKNYVKYQVIGKNNVAVPTHLYKIIIAENSGDTPKALAAFVVPNQPISYEHQLSEYKVPIEFVESHSGFKMVPRLDRTGTVDLCQVDSCQLMSRDRFELYFIGRKVASARTLHRLDTAWKELEQKRLKPDDYLKNLYADKRRELEAAQAASAEE